MLAGGSSEDYNYNHSLGGGGIHLGEEEEESTPLKETGFGYGGLGGGTTSSSTYNLSAASGDQGASMGRTGSYYTSDNGLVFLTRFLPF